MVRIGTRDCYGHDDERQEISVIVFFPNKLHDNIDTVRYER